MNELKPPMLKREDYKAIKHMNREDIVIVLPIVFFKATLGNAAVGVAVVKT